MQSKNEKSKLTCFEMQKTSISSLSRPEGPGKPQELCVLLLVQGPLERNHLLSKDTGRFHPPNSLPKPEAERMSPRGSWAAGSAVAVHFKGTLHYASLRILKQRKELKKKKVTLCHIPKWVPAISQPQPQTCSSAEHNPQSDPWKFSPLRSIWTSN